MIPISLSIEGLYSYRQKQEIDFTQLTQAQLFGIFGATGSGKSSILEAISFALYGQSERLNKQDRRGYNMMNLRSNKLEIQFIFEVQAKRYRFEVNAKRNSKRFEDVKTINRKAYQWENGEWLPLGLSEATSITGLNYQNFRRTIIIPQGKFQEFLQLTDTDRTRMLREIFHLEKYELAQQVGSLEKKNDQRLTELNTQLRELEFATEEQRTALETGLAELEQQSQQLLKAQKEMDAQIEKLKQGQATHQQHQSQQALVNQLLAQEPEITLRTKNLQRYEECLVSFKPLIDRREELGHEIAETNQRLQQRQNQRKTLSQQLETKTQAFQRIKEQYLHRDQLQLKAQELEQVIKLQDEEEKLEALKVRIQNGEKVITETQQAVDTLQTQVNQTKTQIQSQEAKLPDLEPLLNVQQWLVTLQSQENQVQKQKENTQKTQTQLHLLQQEKQRLLKESLLDPHQYQLDLPQVQALLAQHQERLQQQTQQLHQKLAQLRTQAQLKQYAENLQEGEPCPLCGAIHHPEIQAFQTLDAELERLLQEQQSLETQQRAQQQIALSLNQHVLNLSEREAQLKEAEQLQQEAEQALFAHQQKFAWPDYKSWNLEKVNEQIAQAQSLSQSLQRLRQQRSDIEQSQDKESQNLKLYQQKVEQLNQQAQTREISFQSGRQALRAVDYQALKAKDTLGLTQEANRLKEAYLSVEQLYHTTERDVQSLQNQISSLEGEINSLKQQEKSDAQKLAQLNQDLYQQLENSRYADMAEVEKILSQPIQVQQERNALSEFKERLKLAQQQLQTLSQELAKNPYQPAALAQLNSQLALNQQQLNETSKQLGAQQLELKRILEALDSKAQLSAQLEQVEKRADNLKVLKSMFAKSGFVNYISRIYLQNLCLAANHRFRKLTRGSLSLETSEENKFEVRDYLHNGQTRSVKTLSGGQTFQASLSLALALADQIKQQAQADHNFFFLDEGFGSQDKESLQIIFQTLKSLRKEKRIVGIISHVEELQQEIDTYLFVKNHPESGSKIHESWKEV